MIKKVMLKKIISSSLALVCLLSFILSSNLVYANNKNDISVEVEFIEEKV